MEVGLSVVSEIPGLDGARLINAIVERAAAAADVGLDSLHVGDRHHVSEPYAANLALAARLAGIWQERLGILVISSVWNPVLLAEQIATLSAMAPRLDVVMALGHGEREFAGVGASVADRLPLFTEGLAVIRALLDGEIVSARVGPHQITDARVTLRSDVEISWLLAASAPVAIRRAARLGVGWLASAKLTPEDASAALAVYRDAGGDGRAVIRRDVFVGASSTEVVDLAEPVIAAGHRGYPPDAIVRGTVAQVAEEITRLQHDGFDELLARSLMPSQDCAIESIGRLGQARVDVRQRRADVSQSGAK